MAGLGGKNWTFQEEVSSSDVNGFLADQVVMRFANAATRTAGFGGAGEPVLAEGMVSYLDDLNRIEVYNGSAWVAVGGSSADGATLDANQSTSSTSYVDLATVGASITITTGTAAVVSMSCNTAKSTMGNTGFVAFAVSGATTIAASDANCMQASYYAANFAMQLSRTRVITGLTPGLNTFTMKYRIDGGGTAASFWHRSIVVWPLA